MNSPTQDIDYLKQNVITQDDVDGTSNETEFSPELVDHKCHRYALWDIHKFVEQVLASDKPGFAIVTDKQGRLTALELPLAWHYKLIRSYIQRIPPDATPSPLIALFIECCIEMGLHSGFSRSGDFSGPGAKQAECYNGLLDLMRMKASTIAKYIEAKKYVSNYDLRMFKRLQKYIDTLFLLYPKLLVLRLDLEYLNDHADYVTLAQAQRDISRFISHRRWSKLFEHCVGFIVAREHGKNGCGFHFHVILFFNGHERQQDVKLAMAIGEQYWQGYITRLECDGGPTDTRGRYFNCNAKKNDYKYLGIGMVSHSDESMRSNLSYALVYLTKEDQGMEGIAPPKTKTITRGQLPRIVKAKCGRPRKIWIRGKKVQIPRDLRNSHLVNIRITSDLKQ